MKVEKVSLLSSWVTGLFFLGKRALRATYGSTTLFSWDRAFSYYWMHRFKFSYQKKKKSVLHTLCASSMLSTRDIQIYKDQPCYWGVHNSSRERSPVNCSSLCHLVSTIAKICAGDIWWGRRWDRVGGISFTWRVQAPDLWYQMSLSTG